MSIARYTAASLVGAALLSGDLRAQTTPLVEPLGQDRSIYARAQIWHVDPGGYEATDSDAADRRNLSPDRRCER